jgi:hypothetical protein
MKKIQLIIILAGTVAVTMYSCSKDEINGCTDALACNFEPEADVDNGTCTYEQTWMKDESGDGLGNPSLTLLHCNQPAGYVLTPCLTRNFYADADGDGLGDPNNSIIACASDSSFLADYVPNDEDKIDLLTESKQRAVMTYVGATWCGPCGANGDPTKEHIESTFGSDAVILNVQSGDAISASGAFGPDFGAEFQNFVSSTSIPHCYWSAANYTMTDHGFSSSATQFDANVTTILATSATVEVVAEATHDGSVVTVQTATKFLSTSGEHFIGVYLLEDDVQAEQTISGSSPAITGHNNVIREAANTATPLGTQSMGTTFTANERVEGTFTITIPGTVVNSANLQVAVVIWSTNSADGISNAVLVDVN